MSGASMKVLCFIVQKDNEMGKSIKATRVNAVLITSCVGNF